MSCSPERMPSARLRYVSALPPSMNSKPRVYRRFDMPSARIIAPKSKRLNPAKIAVSATTWWTLVLRNDRLTMPSTNRSSDRRCIVSISEFPPGSSGIANMSTPQTRMPSRTIGSYAMSNATSFRM